MHRLMIEGFFYHQWAVRLRRPAAIGPPVEHAVRNDGVTGSNPVCGTSNIKYLGQTIGNHYRS
jgi:hypothetical protein